MLAVFQHTAVDAAGNVLPNAQFSIRNADSSALVALYSDINGAHPIANPTLADSLGYVRVYMSPVRANITLTSGAFASLRADVLIGTANEISFPQSAKELAASVTPYNYYKLPGDLRRYGAIGDDATDNTAAINAAIAQCAQRGDPVYVPAGIFVAGECALASGIRIYGDGWNSCLKLKNAANSRILATTNAGLYVDDILIESLQLDCNKANNSSGGGIILNGRRNVVRNCYVHDAANSGIQSGVGSNGATDTPLAGRLQIIGNVVKNCGKNNSWGQIAVTHGSDILICANVVHCDDGQTDYGIDIEADAGNTLDGIVIANNLVRAGNIQVDGAPLGGSNTARGVVVSNNRVDARGRYKPSDKTGMAPLWFRQIKDFEISGNICYGHATSTMGGLVFEDAGMTTTYSTEAGVVSHNEFRSDVADTRSGYCRVIKDVSFTANQWQVNTSGNALEFSGAGINVRGSCNIINNAGAGKSINIGAGTNIVFDGSNSLTGVIIVAGTACRVAKDDLYGSKTWDIGSTLTQVSVSTQVTVTGATRTKGSYVKSVTHTTLPQGWTLTAAITNTDEVTAVATNVTGSTGDPPSGTLYVTVGQEVLS